MQILFVCTGNTCRSPMAAELLQARIRRAGLDKQIQAVSAGTAVFGAAPASEEATAVMQLRGLDIRRHRSRPVRGEDIRQADLVLTMTAAQRADVLIIVPEAHGRAFTLAEFAGEPGNVSDPYRRGMDCYEQCAQQLDRLIDKAWYKIVGLAGNLQDKTNR